MPRSNFCNESNWEKVLLVQTDAQGWGIEVSG